MVELAEPVDEGWRVITEAGESLRAAALLLTPPATQSIALLAACADQLPSEINSTFESRADTG